MSGSRHVSALLSTLNEDRQYWAKREDEHHDDGCISGVGYDQRKLVQNSTDRRQLTGEIYEFSRVRRSSPK